MDEIFNFLTEEKNISDYWNKKRMVFKKKNEISKFLLDKNELLNVLTGYFEEDVWIEPIETNINVSKINGDGSNSQMLSVNLSQSLNYFNQGYTLCFSDLSYQIQELKVIKDLAASVFNHPDLIFITAYLSPPRSFGVLHFDKQHNFFIQKNGKKKWTISSIAAVENPFDNFVYAGVTEPFLENMKKSGYNIKLPSDCGREEILLDEGDILYLPPGFYHSPETMTDASLHYTLTIEPSTIWSDINKQLFSTFLQNTDTLNKDYRFIPKTEKELLLQKCYSIIKNLNEVD